MSIKQILTMFVIVLAATFVINKVPALKSIVS